MSKKLDLCGQRFGFWVVQKRAENTKNGRIQWVCLCECGNERVVTTNSLRSGNSTSCGCNHNPNLVNCIFGDLKVIDLDLSKTSANKRYWLCECSCGNSCTVSTHQLRNHLVKSCGCKLKEKVTALIVKSKTASKQHSKVMSQNFELIKEQTRIMAEFNEELAKGMALLITIRSEFKKSKLNEPIA
jgi:hypothetical protein